MPPPAGTKRAKRELVCQAQAVNMRRSGRKLTAQKRVEFGEELLPDRVQGVQIYRPFVFGSIAEPLPPVDDPKRPPNLPADHTHRWTVYVRGVTEDSDVTHWLKKVSFKLHESFAQATRTIEAPEKFEVTETGWGEFEIAVRLFFVPEANEKPTPIYHFLKLHPYGDGADEHKAKGLPVKSETYTEIVFVEPLEPFYDILTGGGPPAHAGKTKGGKGKTKAANKKNAKDDDKRTAEIPMAPSPGNEFSMRTEEAELQRLAEANKKVRQMIEDQIKTNKDREEELKKLKDESK